MSFCLVYIVKFGPISVLYTLENKKGIQYSVFEILSIQKYVSVSDLFYGENFGLKMRSPGLESWTLRKSLNHSGSQFLFLLVEDASSCLMGGPCWLGQLLLWHWTIPGCWVLEILSPGYLCSPSLPSLLRLCLGSGPRHSVPESLQWPPSRSMPSVLWLLQGILHVPP